MDEFYPDWAAYFNVSTANWNGRYEFDQSYLTAAILEGTGETDTFGMRLQWKSLVNLSKRLGSFYPEAQTDSERFSAAFSAPKYIHLLRQDKIAQAVSLSRAEQSGLWHVHADGTERERLKTGYLPEYDFETLSKLVVELEDHESAWMSWFGQQNIQPISVTYEDLSSDPETVMTYVLTALGLDANRAGVVKPKTAKLSNKESKEWIECFHKEQNNHGI